MPLVLVVGLLLVDRHDESAPHAAASATGSENRVSTTERTPPAKPTSSASTAEQTFANWSTYHSLKGGFRLYLPDRREEKGHVRSESMGLDGPGVEAQFVQLPNTSEPIESWPAIGEICLRAMWVDSADRDSESPVTLVSAGSSTVTVGDLPGNEFVFKKGNSIQKARLFVKGNRTILLTATFIGRESAESASLPFGEQVDRFLGSLQLDSEPVGKAPASVADGTGEGETASDSFAIVERYVCELAGSKLSEDLIRTRVDDLKTAAQNAQASPQEVLSLLRSAKAEAEAIGISPELAIRAVTGTLGVKAQRKK